MKLKKYDAEDFRDMVADQSMEQLQASTALTMLFVQSLTEVFQAVGDAIESGGGPECFRIGFQAIGDRLIAYSGIQVDIFS